MAVEWVIPGQETRYREQLRFIYPLTDAKWDVVQNVVDFNNTVNNDET